MTEDSDDATVFRDLIMLALLGFVTLVVLMIPHLNPPTKGQDAAKPAGNMIVEIRWPDAMDCDVDLWVQAPHERPVGYSHKSETTFDLLRDDLGVEHDVTGLNYEFAFSRGIPDGEYIINVKLYSNRANAAEVPVSVSVSVTRDGADPTVLYAGRIILHHIHEERTVTRFEMNDSHMVPGSQHDTPRMLSGAPQ